MSKIDDLIAEHCPDGVEYRPLGEVIENLRTGLNPRQNFKLNTTDARHKYITVRELAGFSILPTEKTDLINDEGLARIQARSKLKLGDVLFSGTGTIGRTALVEEVPSTWNIKEGVYALTPKSEVVNPRYLIYTLHSNAVHNRILASADGSTVASVSMSTLRGIRIPVPPLEVQRAIVEILDNFTQLEAELEAELKARKIQYEHFENELTDPFESNRKLKNGWESGFLGDLCRIEKGKTPLQKATPGQYPLVATTADRQSSSEFQFDAEAVCVPLISSRGHGVASISRIYYQSGKFALGNILCAVIPNDPSMLSAAFLRYFLYSRKDFLLVPLMRGGANVSLTIDSLKKVKVQFPSIEEQRRIVDTLDTFEAFVNNDEFGLSAEISARRKQYEHYRDRLLTFKELAS